MARPFYADYVNHCLKTFVVTYDKRVYVPDNETDRANWLACDKVHRQLSDKDKELLDEIYGRFGTIGENIKEVEEEMGIGSKYMWKLVSRVTREIAKERGLI